MSTDDFERDLRDRMKAHAAELDRTTSPAPPLWTLLAAQRTTESPNEPTERRTILRLGFAVAGVAALALALVSGSLLLGHQQLSGPAAWSPVSATVSPSLIATNSTTPGTPGPLQTPLPIWSPVRPEPLGGLTMLEPTMQDEGVLWSPDGQHFALVSADASAVFNVYMFDKAGVWVGEAPGWAVAWASDDSLIVLPYDPTSQDGLLPAYLAKIGYNDVSTMQVLPGRYRRVVGNGHGTAALETAQGYAMWLNGSLLPEVGCACSPLSVSTDGRLVAVEDTGVKVVKTDSGQDVQGWPNLALGAHTHASFSPDGQHLSVSDVDGSLNTLVVLNISNGRRTDLLAGHFSYSGTWMSSGQLFAGDDTGAWWTVPIDGSSPKRTELPNSSRDAVPSSTGMVAAVNDPGSTLLIEQSGKTRTSTLPSPALALYWSPDGTELVVSCESGAVLLAQY